MNMAAAELAKTTAELTYGDFSRVRTAFAKATGIMLLDRQTALVTTRLSRRMRKLGLPTLRAYIDKALAPGASELAELVDLLTTHETFFFREADHFKILRDGPLANWQPGKPFRAWCAACSTGEEVYGLAMTLSETLGMAPWEILGSDISQNAVESARQGHYRQRRLDSMPRAYYSKYLLRGVGRQEGTILVSRELRARTRFEVINLNMALPGIGRFDVVFLRNVLIYFAAEVQSDVIRRVVGTLKPGGLLFIGGSESLRARDYGLEPAGRAAFIRSPR